MNTCKTCKHWGNDPNDEGRFKTCCSPIIKFGYAVDDDLIPDNGAIVENDVGWGIMTGPDFGCVLHEEGACFKRKSKIVLTFP